MASINAFLCNSSTHHLTPTSVSGSNFVGAAEWVSGPEQRKTVKLLGKISAAAAVAATPAEEIKENASDKHKSNFGSHRMSCLSRFALPTWAEFDLGKAPVY
ncbi:hypothetical protein RJ641_020173 [Dillenia turbinata]|uniref:Uncharacterized protein n=1 Tax=Dillenia turbinata TaxID=194707 RepID=A0AAN8UPJ2_9MAGN